VHSVTGLSPFQIKWELPLSEGHAYCHAAAIAKGCRMVWPEVIDHWQSTIHHAIQHAKSLPAPVIED
jgi:hypothetical protein